PGRAQRWAVHDGQDRLPLMVREVILCLPASALLTLGGRRDIERRALSHMLAISGGRERPHCAVLLGASRQTSLEDSSITAVFLL
ncbi:MAG TPA: hypothetical protein VIY07_10465, partial [Pseudolabrys sp.]